MVGRVAGAVVFIAGSWSFENLNLIVFLIYMAFALPAVPLIWSWREIATHHPGALITLVSAVITTSYLWVVAVVAGAPVIAPHYTPARDKTIELNVAALLIGIILVVVRRRVRTQLLLAGCGTIVLWCYLALVGSVV
jgi:hypothetical protein